MDFHLISFRKLDFCVDKETLWGEYFMSSWLAKKTIITWPLQRKPSWCWNTSSSFLFFQFPAYMTNMHLSWNLSGCCKHSPSTCTTATLREAGSCEGSNKTEFVVWTRTTTRPTSSKSIQQVFYSGIFFLSVFSLASVYPTNNFVPPWFAANSWNRLEIFKVTEASNYFCADGFEIQ